MQAIDEAIVLGMPQRQIAEAYRSSPAAIQRHASAHVAPGVSSAASRREDVRYDRLMARMASLAEEGEHVLRSAKNSGAEPRLVLAAIREVRETLSTLAKFSQPQVLDEDVEALVRALGQVLPRFPEAACALADELITLGSEAAAEVIAVAARRWSGDSTSSVSAK